MVQRSMVTSNRRLAEINPKEDRTIHPVPLFAGQWEEGAMSCKRPNKYTHDVIVRTVHLPGGNIKPLMFRGIEAGDVACLIHQIWTCGRHPR